MYKYEVNIKVYMEKNRSEEVIITVEAGNKKLAAIRALLEINKNPKYKDLYKNVEEVKITA